MPRRATLTTDAITAAALRVGDREGPAAMSMRRIANELGCDPMALYRYAENRTALLDGIVELILGELDLLFSQTATIIGMVCLLAWNLVGWMRRGRVPCAIMKVRTAQRTDTCQ